ncbi:MAG: prenyltransferase/squalene oxidase repeat-containing protein [Candidatus Asgardarchaeia archaeon]
MSVNRIKLLVIFSMIVLIITSTYLTIPYSLSDSKNDAFSNSMSRKYDGLSDIYRSSIFPLNHKRSILYVYDPTTGYPIIRDSFIGIFSEYFQIDSVQLSTFLSFSPSNLSEYLAVVIDPSIGGLHGKDVSYEEAKKILLSGKPLLLLGASHGVIDRFEGIPSTSFQKGPITVASFSSEVMSHDIFNRPFHINASLQISVPSQSSDYYISSLLTSNMIPLGYNDSNVVLLFYENPKLIQKTMWFAVDDLSNITTACSELITNILFWLTSTSRVTNLIDFILHSQILNGTSYLGYGGFSSFSEGLITNTYFFLQVCKMLNLSYNPYKTSIIQFLLKHYNSTSGSFEDYDVITSLWSTAWVTGLAVSILADLNSLDMINVTLTLNYLLSLQDSSGGFRSDSQSNDVNILNSFGAVKGIYAIDKTLSGVNKTALISYISSLQILDDTSSFYGGFKLSTTYPMAKIRYSYYALELLNLLNSSSSIDTNALSIFINNLEQDNGGFVDNIYSDSYWSTGLAVYLLSEIGRIDSLNNFTKTQEFLLGLQAADGGFTSDIGEKVTTVDWTYYSVLGLNSIGVLPRRVSSLESFLKSLFSPNGGMGYPPSWGSIFDTYFALKILNITGASSSIFNITALLNYLNDSYVPNGYFFMTRYFSESVPLPIKYRAMYWPLKGVIETQYGLFSLQLLGALSEFVNLYGSTIISTLNSSQCVDSTSPFYGMFSYIPIAFYNNFTIRYTFTMSATYLLQLLNALDSIKDIYALKEYMNRTFSYSIYPRPIYDITLPPSYTNVIPLYTTYSSLIASEYLGILNDTILSNAFRVVNTYTNNTDLRTMYFKLKILEFLGKYNSSINYMQYFNKSIVLSILLSHQTKTGYFNDTVPADYWLESSSFALELVHDLKLTFYFDRSFSLTVASLSFNWSNTLYLGKHYMIKENVIEEPFYNLQINSDVFANVGSLTYTFTNLGNGSYWTGFSINSSEYLGPIEIQIFSFYKLYSPAIVCISATVVSSLNISYHTNKPAMNFTTRDTLEILITVKTPTNVLINDASVTGTIENKSLVFDNLLNGSYISNISLANYEGFVNITLHVDRVYCTPALTTFQIFVFNSSTVTKLNINATRVSWGEYLNLTILISNSIVAPDGTATILLDGIPIKNVTIKNSLGSYLFKISPNTPLGLHNITCIFNYYNQDALFLPSSDTQQFTVFLEPDAILNVNNTAIYTNEFVLINGLVKWSNISVNCNVSLLIYDVQRNTTVFAENYSASDVSLVWSTNRYGMYNITFSIIGNESVISSEKWVIINVEKQEIVINVIGFKNSKYYHENMTINLTAISTISNYSVEIPLSLYVNDSLIISKVAPVEITILYTDIPMGIVNISIVFSGNDTFSFAVWSKLVEVIPSQVNISISSVAIDHDFIISNFSVFSQYGGIPKNVNIDVVILNPLNQTVVVTSLPISNLTISWIANITGHYRIIVTFNGLTYGFERKEISFLVFWDSLYLYDPVDLLITSSTTKIYAYQTVNISIELSNDVYYLNANLTIYRGNELITTARIFKSNRTFSFLPEVYGVYNLTITWFNASTVTSKSLLINVAPIPINFSVSLNKQEFIVNENAQLTINISSSRSFINGVLIIELNNTVINKIPVLSSLTATSITCNLTNLRVGVFYLKVHFTSKTFENATWSTKIVVKKIPVILKVLSYTDQVTVGDKVRISLQLINNITGKPIYGQKISLLIFWPVSGEAQLSNITNADGIVVFDIVAVEEGTIPVSIDFLGTSTYSSSHLSIFVTISKTNQSGAPSSQDLDEPLVMAGFAIISISSLPILYVYRRVNSQVRKLFRAKHR